MKWTHIIIGIGLWAGCSEAEKPKPMPNPRDQGAEIFKKNCVLCHGIDGKLGLNGAKDLSVSQLSEPERINIITNGKSAMPVFGKLLTTQEIETVAHYSRSLNKQLAQ